MRSSSIALAGMFTTSRAILESSFTTQGNKSMVNLAMWKSAYYFDMCMPTNLGNTHALRRGGVTF